jgi:mono/diheme cytochrome c family protein
MLRITIGLRVGVGLAALALVAALAVPAALGSSSKSSTLTPAQLKKAKASAKASFSSTCSACHTLKAAGAVGNIGPNLDKVPLPQAKIIIAITKGGASIMTKAQIAKYTTQMVAYKGVLSTSLINNIAAFVYESQHKGSVGVYVK